MKKLLFIGLLAILMSSCVRDAFNEDPSIKESERISALEKAKTDTLNIVIMVDKRAFIVRKGVIVSVASTEDQTLAALGFGLLVGAFAGGLFIGGMMSKY